MRLIRKACEIHAIHSPMRSIHAPARDERNEHLPVSTRCRGAHEESVVVRGQLELAEESRLALKRADL
jgi:hypothetical protein